VNTVIIPRACDNYSPNAEGLIFVEFDSVHSARQVASVLNGRKFADKTVVVAFVSNSFILALHSCRFLRFFICASSAVRRAGVCLAKADIRAAVVERWCGWIHAYCGF
jgi:hypothetical protein